MKWDPSELEKLGFRDPRIEGKERPSLEQHHASLVSLLTSYATLGYEFAVAEDEIIVAERNHEQVRIFGRSFSGAFFIYGNKSEVYHAMEGEITICNSSIDTFVKTYSLFISKVCLLKAYFDDDDDRALSRGEECAREFAEFYTAIEKKLRIDNSFWSEGRIELEEMFVQLRPPLIYYINAGKIAFPKRVSKRGSDVGG
jgi:hypothetical protein